MTRKYVLSGLLFLLLILPAAVMAKGMMHGKWWHAKAIKQELGLSENEIRILDEKYIESRRKMIDLKNDVEKQRFELDLLLSEQYLDRDKIMAQYENLEQARARLSRERFEMFMAIRETLGAERFQELKLMRRDRYSRDRKEFSSGRNYRDRD